jgi:hypothetical protein
MINQNGGLYRADSSFQPAVFAMRFCPVLAADTAVAARRPERSHAEHIDGQE